MTRTPNRSSRHPGRNFLVAGMLAGALCVAFAQSATPAAPEAPAADKATIDAAFQRADVNGDNKLSREEAARMPAIAARFADFDKNKDGFLSVEEFSAGATSMPK